MKRVGPRVVGVVGMTYGVCVALASYTLALYLTAGFMLVGAAIPLFIRLPEPPPPGRSPRPPPLGEARA